MEKNEGTEKRIVEAAKEVDQERGEGGCEDVGEYREEI